MTLFRYAARATMALTVAVLAGPAWSQPVNPLLVDEVATFTVELNEAASATRRDLERAEAFLKNEQWDEAIDTYRRLIEEDSDRVIAANYGAAEPGPYAIYIPVRAYCQMRLARLAAEAPEVLALYRRRVDPVARQWLEQATARKDAALLQRLVRQMFASSHGDDALFVLGEIELERGNLATARGLWERISPLLRTPVAGNWAVPAQQARPIWMALQGLDLDAHWDDLAPALTEPTAPGSWFVYPDTDLDLAAVRARLTLVSILEGSPDRAAIELAVLTRLHPEAEGVLGGRSGRYAELLASLLEQSRAWADVKPPVDWPTFAGSQDRNRKAARGVDVAGRPLWTHAFDKSFTIDNGSSARVIFPGESIATSDSDEPPVPVLSYHPVVIGDMVLYSDWRHIYALRLDNGQPAVPLGLDERQAGAIYVPPQSGPFAFDSALSSASRLGAPRFTLNVQGNRLVARMGSPITGEVTESLTSRQPGYLVSLDLASFKLLHDDIRPDGSAWAFEGTPVTDGQRLYVAMRQSEIRAVAYVACFDMQTGERLWRRKIGSAETFGRGQRQEITHNLLSLAEGTLYYNTNFGAVAALSITDGEVKWITRYPRISHRRGDERPDPRYLRDLNPCVLHKGLVLTFPADGNQIFALDAMSGQLLWATPEASTPDVAHLLGVAHDHLIVGGKYLYWLNAHSGRFLAQFPENAAFGDGAAFPDPHGLGRGVLAGDLIYWPTQSNTAAASNTGQMKIQVLQQQLRRTERRWQAVREREIDLGPRTRGIPLDGANLVIANGVLLLATPKHLIAFGE